MGEEEARSLLRHFLATILDHKLSTLEDGSDEYFFLLLIKASTMNIQESSQPMLHLMSRILVSRFLRSGE